MTLPKTRKPRKKILNSVLYVYLEQHIAVYAKREGIYKFGSTSAYINYLIAKDWGDIESVNKMKALAKDKYHVKRIDKMLRGPAYRKEDIVDDSSNEG